MSNRFLRSSQKDSSFIMAMLMASLLFGCGIAADREGDTSKSTSMAPPRLDSKSPPNNLYCVPYDESYCDSVYNCEVSSSHVPCSNGLYADAWITPDCRWCISRDACKGDIICPFE